MSFVEVVSDASPTLRWQAGGMLRQVAGWQVSFARQSAQCLVAEERL